MNKVSNNRKKKEVIVAELSEKVAKAKAIVFASYQGMTHIQLEHLKKSLKSSQAEVVVAKNTLIKIALDQNQNAKGKIQNENDLKGGTITLFAYNDIILPLKEIAKSFKLLKLPEIKFGILDGKTMSAIDLLKLSTLPSKEILLAQLVGTLKSPIFGLHRALSWNLQQFVMTLKAIETKKTQT